VIVYACLAWSQGPGIRDAEKGKPGYVLVVGRDGDGLAPACSALREAGFD